MNGVITKGRRVCGGPAHTNLIPAMDKKRQGHQNLGVISSSASAIVDLLPVRDESGAQKGTPHVALNQPGSALREIHRYPHSERSTNASAGGNSYHLHESGRTINITNIMVIWSSLRKGTTRTRSKSLRTPRSTGTAAMPSRRI